MRTLSLQRLAFGGYELGVLSVPTDPMFARLDSEPAAVVVQENPTFEWIGPCRCAERFRFLDRDQFILFRIDRLAGPAGGSERPPGGVRR